MTDVTIATVRDVVIKNRNISNLYLIFKSENQIFFSKMNIKRDKAHI